MTFRASGWPPYVLSPGSARPSTQSPYALPRTTPTAPSLPPPSKPLLSWPGVSTATSTASRSATKCAVGAAEQAQKPHQQHTLRSGHPSPEPEPLPPPEPPSPPSVL